MVGLSILTQRYSNQLQLASKLLKFDKLRKRLVRKEVYLVTRQLGEKQGRYRPVLWPSLVKSDHGPFCAADPSTSNWTQSYQQLESLFYRSSDSSSRETSMPLALCSSLEESRPQWADTSRASDMSIDGCRLSGRLIERPISANACI